MSVKRILVSGGAGFLGSHLCARLVGEGHEVLCVDNYYTGRREKIATLLGQPNFEAMRHDVTQPLFVEADEIYNLACPASPLHYQRDPVATTKTSVLGALNLLGLAKRCNARILQASTSEVYGDPETHPQPESYRGNVSVTGPRACYDEGKRCAETLCFDYRRQHGVRIKVVRLFNTYGPWMAVDDGRVISTFVNQALCGEPIAIHGDGRQTRSFGYVEDVIDAMMAVMRTPDDVTGPVNIGNPEEVEIRELAGKVAQLCASDAEPEHRERQSDDPRRRCPDISYLTQLTGWRPRTSLIEGLDRTVAHFRERMAGTGTA